MEFDDKTLANVIAVQRNNAQNDAAQAHAMIANLQEQIKAKDTRIAELEKPMKKKGK